MRQKRAKSYKKQMLVYQHTFKFRDPYQVLLDDQVIVETYNSNFNLIKAICKTLQVESVKPMITQCCMQKLYETKNQHMISMAKEMFERRRCNHNIKEPEQPIDCIHSVVDVNGANKHRYVIVTQDIELRRKLRKIPGVPLIHINRSVMVMEPLSDASKQISEFKEQRKLTSGLNDAKFAGLVKTKEMEELEQQQQEEHFNKKKRAKGANPLSMKKKQKKVPVHEHQTKKVDTGNNETATGSESNNRKSPKKNEETESAEHTETSTKRKRKRKHSSKTKSDESPEDVAKETGDDDANKSD